MEEFTDVPAYLRFKTLMRCIEGWMMGFTQSERAMQGEPGRLSACVPFIAQLCRKSLLMEHHLQGTSLLLRWVERNGRDVHLKMKREATGTRRGGEKKNHGIK